MFPREFVDTVMWPYIRVYRPTLVATRHVPVRGGGVAMLWCTSGDTRRLVCLEAPVPTVFLVVWIHQIMWILWTLLPPAGAVCEQQGPALLGCWPVRALRQARVSVWEWGRGLPMRGERERRGGSVVGTACPPTSRPPAAHPPRSVHDMMGMAEHITPHRVRHICVTYVMQRPEVFGEAHEDMAGVMGHALRMWTEVYDEAVNNKSMTAAARALERLRGELRAVMEDEAVERAAAVNVGLAAPGERFASFAEREAAEVAAAAAAATLGEEPVSPAEVAAAHAAVADAVERMEEVLSGSEEDDPGLDDWYIDVGSESDGGETVDGMVYDE